MRIWAIAKRIMQQMVRDKRSMALLFIAPLFIMTLLWLVFDGGDYEPAIAVSDLPAPFEKALEKQDVHLESMTPQQAHQALENQEVDAFVFEKNRHIHMTVEGSDATATGAVKNALIQASEELAPKKQALDVAYLYGSDDLNMFDNIGSALIAFFVFFFTFLISGISFLRERTQGTLERLLAMPVKRYEIVAGYFLGFGIFVVVQSVLVVLYAVLVLDIYMVGQLWEVLIVAILLAFSALGLGTLLSTFANNEFQVMQFIPIVVVPQIFFVGLFHFGYDWLEKIGKIMPLHYGADALKEIMIRNRPLTDIWIDLTVIAGLAIVFLLLNVVALKKYRKL
ncbi:ABC transporter permease [Virgibacillus sp. 179-BFC.A HS]|uniref:ABC transporter permease n=1 Tax=Tigheibacillus jepli TaxID=3035914 RepID=A0ABU5CE36_9BACI|nr:ABC transporter permease [Virgibacillus sp. 179-BFC.A HS]MDY0404595.1 ABC transporter permease [Virgibacillus sp. 179-BFC.A HS]